MAKFHVGQHCIFVMRPGSGWERADGEPCVVTEPLRRVDVWCADMDGSNRNLKRGSPRYGVRWSGGELYVRERDLRTRDGDELSTWDEFKKATGINVLAELATLQRPPRPKIVTADTR